MGTSMFRSVRIHKPLSLEVLTEFMVLVCLIHAFSSFFFRLIGFLQPEGEKEQIQRAPEHHNHHYIIQQLLNHLKTSREKQP